MSSGTTWSLPEDEEEELSFEGSVSMKDEGRGVMVKGMVGELLAGEHH